MAATDTSAKLRQLHSAMDAGDSVGREDVMRAMVDAADLLDALEVSNRRLRDGLSGAEQLEWGRQVAAAIGGYMANPNVEAQRLDPGVLDDVAHNATVIAEEILVHWRMRWVDGKVPKPRRARKDPPRQGPQERIIPPEEMAGRVREVLDSLGPEPAPRTRPEAVAGDSGAAATLLSGGDTRAAPVVEPAKPAASSQPVAPPAPPQPPPPAPKPAKPEPPRQRMEGED